MFTLFDQEHDTAMMLLSERKEAVAEGEARGEAKGIITLLKRQGASFQNACEALQEMLSMDQISAENMARRYW